jgi:TRAP-type C4-dicarboxylate transport system permease small subunit
MRTVARLLEERTAFLSSVLWVISGVGMVAMVTITVADAFGRRFFSSPIFGSYESVTWLLSVVIFSSLAYCTIKRGHFVIDVVTSHFSPRARLHTVTIMYLLSWLISWVMAWRLVLFAMALMERNLTGTEFTSLPVYPFGFFGAACMVIVGWAFLVQFIGYLAEITSGNGFGPINPGVDR